MDSLFSHGDAGAATDIPGTPPASLTADVTVPRNCDDSFAGFTGGIHLWWPVDQTHFGVGTHPEFTQGELFEEDATGRSVLWAAVLGPPTAGELKLAWHHQGNPNDSTDVTVSFRPDEAGTRVSVVHEGWAEGKHGLEQFAAAPDWSAALRRYRRFMGAAA